MKSFGVEFTSCVNRNVLQRLCEGTYNFSLHTGTTVIYLECVEHLTAVRTSHAAPVGVTSVERAGGQQEGALCEPQSKSTQKCCTGAKLWRTLVIGEVLRTQQIHLKAPNNYSNCFGIGR